MKLLLFALLLAIPVLAQNDQHATCYDDRGRETRCADGKFYGSDGKQQPDTCNNNFENTHKCECSVATTDSEHCPPEGRAGMDMSKCQVWCREDACLCVNQCDFTGDAK